jgi:hypothetical protein
MCPGAQNMKTGSNALGTTENELGAQKIKTGPTPSVLPKMSSGAQNMETEPDDLGTAKNESERAKYQNGTRHPRYRRKRVRARKT